MKKTENEDDGARCSENGLERDAPARIRETLYPTQKIMFYIANSDYEEKDRAPIRLQAGDEVQLGDVDRAWPGWVWAKHAAGSSGYVPLEMLKELGDGRWVVIEAFDPTVLTVKRGDRLESTRQIHGWHWCRNGLGVEGWVAGYLLRPD
jgi:Variant SH3 domain